MEEKLLLISFSGGRTSAFMAKFLLEMYPKREKVFVFANTGKERNETLDFVNECDNRWGLGVVWIEFDLDENGKSTFKVVDYGTASRSGEPFEKMLSKYGIPNLAFPHCARELKQGTIKRYMRSVYANQKYKTAIGIRYDERHRINYKTAEKDQLVYPLAHELKVDKNFIRDWWSRQDFDLRLKDYQGNCDLCYKKSDRKILTIIKENPNQLDWWREMEKKYGEGQYTFFRGNRTASDMIELSKGRFRVAVDEYENDQKQSKLFDVEYDCFCKSS